METILDKPAGNQIEKVNGQYFLGQRLVSPHPPNAALIHAFRTFAEEGLLDLIWYESPPTLEWFLEHYDPRERIVLGCYQLSESGGWRIEGLGWLNSIVPMADGRFRKAECGMAFFRKTRRPLEYGRLMLDWVFSELQLDALFGTTPEPNKPALRFAKALGFCLHGPLPCYCSWKRELAACYISSMTRREFLEQSMSDVGQKE